MESIHGNSAQRRSRRFSAQPLVCLRDCLDSPLNTDRTQSELAIAALSMLELAFISMTPGDLATDPNQTRSLGFVLRVSLFLEFNHPHIGYFASSLLPLGSWPDTNPEQTQLGPVIACHRAFAVSRFPGGLATDPNHTSNLGSVLRVTHFLVVHCALFASQ